MILLTLLFGPSFINLLTPFIRNMIEAARLQVLHQYQNFFGRIIRDCDQGMESTASEDVHMRFAFQKCLIYSHQHSLQSHVIIKITVTPCKQPSHQVEKEGRKCCRRLLGNLLPGHFERGSTHILCEVLWLLQTRRMVLLEIPKCP